MSKYLVLLSILSAFTRAFAAPGAPLPDGPTEQMTTGWRQRAFMQGRAGPVGNQTGALCGFGHRGDAAKSRTAVNNDTAIDHFAELDGTPYDTSKFRRILTVRCSDLFVRAPPEAGSYMGDPAASDGFWVKLQPLAPGRRLLKFGGRYNKASSAFSQMVEGIEYELIVR